MMLEKKKLAREDLGERADVLPGRDPELSVSVPRIPVSEASLSSHIIPVAEPLLDGNELTYVESCVRSGWISSAGKFVRKFEESFSDYCGSRHGVACSSGTAALHLTLAALGLGPGDEVIVPTFSMIATANAVSYTGATPVLVDSDARTWNIDPNLIEARLTPATKALLIVHTYGLPVEMHQLLDIAARYKLEIIEDAAEAHGASWRERRVGTIGRAGCFSFYANKIITTGEGGMVTTSDDDLAEVICTLRDHAFSAERHFWHEYRGFNYRMSNLQAAIGVAQTERIEELIATRRRNALLYSAALTDIDGLRPQAGTPDCASVFWMYGLIVEDSFRVNRDELRRHLAKNGIETRTFFIPIHLQPTYFDHYRTESFPVAEDLCRRGLYLPSSPTLTEAQIEFVVSKIAECV